MLDEFLPRRPYVPLVHSGSSNASMAATEKPRDRTSIADVQSRSPPSPGKCNVRFAPTEDQDKSENVSDACIMMTGGVGPTKQSIQRSFPRFSSVFPTPLTHKLILVVRLRKAELGAFRPASAAIKQVIIGRARDPILTSSRPPPIRRESPNHRCPATIADGEGAAQHAGLQRRSFVPRRPS